MKGIAEIKPQMNPVIIVKIERYTKNMLLSLIEHTQLRIKQFETVLNQMKLDYQELFDSLDSKPLLIDFGNPTDVQYIEKYVTKDLYDNTFDVIQLSMRIQKGKYDGSDKEFKTLTMKDIFNNISTKEKDIKD